MGRRLILPVFVFLMLGVSSWAQAQSPGHALGQNQLQGLVKGGVASERLAKLVQQRGIDFKPSKNTSKNCERPEPRKCF